jgi:hypothetical protein
MDKNASPQAHKTPQDSPEAPFATFIRLDGSSNLPSQFRVPGSNLPMKTRAIEQNRDSRYSPEAWSEHLFTTAICHGSRQAVCNAQGRSKD